LGRRRYFEKGWGGSSGFATQRSSGFATQVPDGT